MIFYSIDLLAAMLYQEEHFSVSIGNTKIASIFGKCILFMHNLIQLVLEILIITLIASNYRITGEKEYQKLMSVQQMMVFGNFRWW